MTVDDKVSPRMRELLLGFARHIRGDEASTDEFLTEGMSFGECLSLMDHVANAVEQYAKRPVQPDRH